MDLLGSFNVLSSGDIRVGAGSGARVGSVSISHMLNTEVVSGIVLVDYTMVIEYLSSQPFD